MSLEGGYDLTAICDSAEECVRALLEDEVTPIVQSELHRAPCQNAIKTLQKTIAIQVVKINLITIKVNPIINLICDTFLLNSCPTGLY